MNLMEIFSFPPLVKGFVALLAAGVSFPLVGVFILRLHLIPLRYMLMHGVFLGGSLALALGTDPLLLGLGFNLLIIATLAPLARAARLNAGVVSALFTTVTMAGAFIAMYKFAVPAKDVLSLLWGNIYALSWLDVAVSLGWAACLGAFVFFFFTPISAALFDREIAFSAGINEKLVLNLISVAAGFTVTLSLKLLGALLLDAVLLLPVAAAFLVARSARGLFLLSAVLGLIFVGVGFFTAASLDIPASSGVTVAGAAGFAACFAYAKLKRKTAGEKPAADGPARRPGETAGSASASNS